MPTQYSLVALLDVLAYRNQLKKDRESGNEILKTKLEIALSSLSSINETELSYQAISDTIIIAANPSMDLSGFLTNISKVQREFLKSGLLLRGGIAFEQHFKSGNLTYSHALSVAYELEQKQAIYPRVVIDKSVIDMLRNGDKFSDQDAQSIFNNRLICSQNGIYFVNFVANNESDCYEWAKMIYESERINLDGHESELAKHRWLQDYIISYLNHTRTKYMGDISNLTN